MIAVVGIIIVSVDNRGGHRHHHQHGHQLSHHRLSHREHQHHRQVFLRLVGKKECLRQKITGMILRLTPKKRST